MPSSIYRSEAARVRVRDWCEERLDAWPVPHRRTRVETSAGLTSVIQPEPGPGVGHGSIVLIPGTNMNAAVSLGFAKALARVGPLTVLDVPGQPGLSSGERPRRRRMDWYGQWLTETLAQVTSEPAVVVGHSLGGAIALASGSDLIAGRVLVSSAGLVRLRVDASVMGATMPWLLRPTVARAERLLRHMSSPGAAVPEELSRWMALVGSSCHSSLAPAPLPSAVLARARNVPNMVVVGSHDAFLAPGRLGPVAERRLGTVLRVLDGTGHLLPEESPEHLASLVSEFSRAHGRH
ncbi:alpha/beta hydrolase [Streptomyces sp. SJL17-1]|uniref:alpha/beta fold hydrolase n=1 Tax=Streptomyces sp. SJL17-1 TaxID=2967223 RepID=UPI00296630FB|nr:alpha/beta hydrolase [Streptomyces sp. SJL17-1]